MKENTKCLYGDGDTEVVAGPDVVVFNQAGENVVVSHATMREIMLAWERHELMEGER
jgi:hypothetical protein